ncbi:MAG: hypothetical protein CMJ18_20840 [Phycisphaeraceae bacterium]|nr:hypothetical protein [Phycisphaeraceae bacterium]
MARFNFRYDAVLRQRQAAENECQRDLARSLRERMVLQTQLRSMHQSITDSRHALADGLVGRVAMDRVAHFARSSGQFTVRAQQFVMRLAALEKQIQQDQHRLAEVTRARKALDVLRDRDESKWRRGQRRLEGARLDEAAIQRFGREGGLEHA